MSTPLLLGIEIGGTKLQIGVGRGDGQLLGLERRQVQPSKGAEGILAEIGGATSDLLARLNIRPGDLAAVGIGFGGPVDSSRGIVTLSHQIDGWDGFPLSEWIKRALGVDQVVLQNDADTAALGEARFGAGVGYSPVLYVTIGSGIGGGLIVGGEIYQGSGRGALEIGHLIVHDDADFGSMRRPLEQVTLEGLASGWSIGRSGADVIARALAQGKSPHLGTLFQLCEGDPAKVTAALVSQAASEGDELAVQLLKTAWQAMGRALAHAVTLLAPRRIILGGGVSLIGEAHWFEPIRRETDRRVFPPFRGSYDIVPAALAEEVVVHGALGLALDAFRRQ
jgi:glucokinase